MTARGAFGAGLALIGVVVLILLVMTLSHIIAVIFIGVVVGVTLSPLADRLERYHVPRAMAVLSVYLLIAAILGAFGWYAERSITSDFDKFSSSHLHLPGGVHLPSGDDIRKYLKDNVKGLSGTITTSVFDAFNIAIDFVTVFVVGVLFVVTKDRLQDLILSLTPPEHRESTARIIPLLGQRLRRAVLGLFLGMVAIGVLTYIGLRIIGLPFLFVLAFVAFVTEILPFIGPWLAFIPAVLVAVTQGWVMVLETTAVYLVVYQFEAHVLVPILHSTVNRMPALLVMVAVLVGGSLMGILGALLAIPVAVTLHALFFEAFEPWWQRRIGAAPGREGQQPVEGD